MINLKVRHKLVETTPVASLLSTLLLPVLELEKRIIKVLRYKYKYHHCIEILEIWFFLRKSLDSSEKT